MTRWDRYLFGRVWSLFWRTLLVLAALFVAIDFLTHRRDHMLEQGVSGLVMAKYYALLLPTVLTQYQGTALAAFVAALLVLNRAAQRNEAVALLAGGIPLRRIVAPVLIFGGTVTLVVFAAGQLVTPRTSAEATAIELDVFGDQPRWAGREMGSVTWAHLPEGWLCHIGRFNRQAMSGEDVLLTRIRPEATQVVRARRIYWDEDVQTWWLEQGTAFQYFPEDSMSREAIRFGRRAAPILEGPKSLFSEAVRMSTLDLRDSFELARALESEGRSNRRVWMHIHTQLSQPFLALIMTALAAPFGLRFQRSGGAALGLVLSVIGALAYLLVFGITQGLGGAGRISPAAAGWVANGGFALLAAYLWQRMPT